MKSRRESALQQQKANQAYRMVRRFHIFRTLAVLGIVLSAGRPAGPTEASGDLLEAELSRVALLSSCNPGALGDRPQRWQTSDRGEIRDGLNRVFGETRQRKRGPILSDGRADDAASYETVADRAGDGSPDLLESGAAVDAANNLVFFFRTQHRPAAGIYYVLHIDLFGDRNYDVTFFVSFAPDGKYEVAPLKRTRFSGGLRR